MFRAKESIGKYDLRWVHFDSITFKSSWFAISVIILELCNIPFCFYSYNFAFYRTYSVGPDDTYEQFYWRGPAEYFLTIVSVVVLFMFIHMLFYRHQSAFIQQKNNKVKSYKKRLYYKNDWFLTRGFADDINGWADSFKLPETACIVIRSVIPKTAHITEYFGLLKGVELRFQTEKDFVFWALSADSELLEKLSTEKSLTNDESML